MLAVVPVDAIGVWQVLQDIVVLLAASLLMGTLAERLGQSVIVGYLIAGTLVGPNVLGWISTQAELVNIAELGVALLLFAIGLEFSPRRLLSLGSIVLKTGPLQVVLTRSLVSPSRSCCGLDAREALVVGMMVAVSSTACVLRLLTDRAEIDSEHGRTALGDPAHSGCRRGPDDVAGQRHGDRRNVGADRWEADAGPDSGGRSDRPVLRVV